MGRHHDENNDGVADFAEQHPYGEAEPAPRRGVSSSSGLTATTLRTAMGASLSLERYAALLPAFTSLLVQANATTVNRAAMVMAQCGHESVGLKFPREIWGPNAQQLKYDPASGSDLSKRLGNTKRGDGYDYRGAGWLQVTGRGHFSTVSRWAFDRKLVPTATYFVDHPDELGSDRYVWIGPCWYWVAARPQLNAFADVGDIRAASVAVNGGTYGLEDRTKRWKACLALGTAILPGAAPAPAAPARPTPALMASEVC